MGTLTETPSTCRSRSISPRDAKWSSRGRTRLNAADASVNCPKNMRRRAPRSERVLLASRRPHCMPAAPREGGARRRFDPVLGVFHILASGEHGHSARAPGTGLSVGIGWEPTMDEPRSRFSHRQDVARTSSAHVSAVGGRLRAHAHHQKHLAQCRACSKGWIGELRSRARTCRDCCMRRGEAFGRNG